MQQVISVLARYRVWIFPGILTLLLVILTLASISGSSIGVYDGLLGEKSHVLTGEARSVRSDEWLVNTPLTLSQDANSYPVRNPDIGNGNDMAITVDVPYKEWSIVFKPQNLAFFVLPFSMAFAFKWWLLSYVLLLAVYAFVLHFFKGRVLLAALSAVAFTMSPFIQWWYQSITILPVAYSLIGCVLALKLTQEGSLKKKLLLAALLSYTLVCFALVLYPPFQITCALVAAMVFVAAYIGTWPGKKKLLADAAWLAPAVVVALLVVGAFLFVHREAVSAELHTIYPGNRVVASGGLSLGYMMGWPLDHTLMDGNPIFGNQSESSNFLLFGILLLPYLAYCLWRYRKPPVSVSGYADTKVFKPLLIGSVALTAIFAARQLIPVGDILYKPFGLSAIPLNRLFLGLGIINVLLVCLAVARPFAPSSKLRQKKDMWYLPSVLIGIVALGYFAFVMAYVKTHYTLPWYIGKFELAGLAIASAGIVALLCHQVTALRYTGLCLLVGFGIYSSANINPLYRGLGSLHDGRLVHAIEKAHQSDPESAWVVSNKMPLEALPMSLGAHSYSGVYPYPQKSLWHKYFPQDSFIYNRFAHVEFSVNDKTASPKLTLLQGDTFIVKLPSCSPLLKDLHIGFILTTNKTIDGFTCYKLRSTTVANGTPIYIYSRR